MTRAVVRLAIAASIGLAGFVCSACDGAGVPTTPTGPACRTYATAINAVLTTPGTTPTFVQTYATTCAFDPATSRLTCSSQYFDTAACRTSVVAVTNYRFVADFIDEVRVIPPLTLATNITSTTTNTACPAEVFAPLGEVIYTYDDQRRLIQSFFSFTSQTTLFNQWDDSRRPIFGQATIPGTTTPVTITYDDLLRRRNYNNAGRQILTTFDANGNRTEETITTNIVAGTMVVTNAATAQVCR